jgi:hypothetical protein
MDATMFAKSVAQSYGVELDKSAVGALQKLFNNPALVGDASKFMPAVMGLLGDHLGGDDAKSKKSIAGMARNYRDASMGGVDTERLFADVMKAIANSPSLANAIFGSKQGARIKAAMGDPELFLHKLDELKNHSEGFAQKVSDERMSGFDGAVSRFENAVKNLETQVGRSLDNNGKGGMLTYFTDKLASSIQAMAEAPAWVSQVGVGLTAAGTVVATAVAGQFLAAGGTVTQLIGKTIVGAFSPAVIVPAVSAALATITKDVFEAHPEIRKAYEENSMLGAMDSDNALAVAIMDAARLGGEQAALAQKARDDAAKKKDFTLGSRGGFTSAPYTETQPGSFGLMSNRGGATAGGLAPLAQDIANVGLQADAAGDKMRTAFGQIVRPQVDGSSVLEFIRLLDSALGKVSQLNGGLIRELGSLKNALGQTQRGHFTAGGVQGEY